MATGTPTNVGQVQLNLILNSQQFQTQLQTAVRQSVAQAMSARARNQVTATFTKLGQIAAAAFSVHALSKFVQQCLELGSTFAEVQNVIDTTYKTMSDKADAWAANALKNYGMTEDVAKNYLGTIGSMAQGFGFTEEQALKMGETLTGLVGDVASFRNWSTDEAFTRLKGIFTGETEAIEQLGISLKKTSLDEYAMAKGYGKTTAKMTEQEKIALRYNYVLERLSYMQGDFQKTSGSWANQMKIVASQWKAFQSNIGQGLIPMLTPAINAVNRLMERLVRLSALFKVVMQQIYGKQETAAGATTETQAEAMAQLADNTASVGTAAAGTAKKLKSLMGFDQLNVLASQDSGGGGGVSGGGALSPMDFDLAGEILDLPDAMDFTNEEIEKFKQNLIKATKTAGTLGATLGGMKLGSSIAQLFGLSGTKGGLGGGLIAGGGVLEAMGIYEGLTKGFSGGSVAETLLGGGALTGGAAIIGSMFGQTLLGAGIGGIVAGIPAFAAGVIDAIKNGLNLANGTLIPFASTAAGAGVGAVIGALGGPVGAGIGALVGLVIGALTDLGIWLYQHWDEVKSYFTTGWKMIVRWFKKEWNAFSNWWNTGLENLTNWIKTKWETIKLATQVAWAAIQYIFTSVWQKIKETFQNTVDGIKNTWSNIMDWFSTKLDTFKTKWLNTFNGIKTGISNAVSSLSSVLRAPLNSMISLVNRAISGLNRISVDIPKWVPGGYGGKSFGFNLAQIPYLAKGGYIGPNSPRLAVIGDNKREGEIVAPESKIAEAMSTQMGPVLSALSQLISIMAQKSGGDITIPILLDGQVLDTYIINAQNRATLRSGGRA